MSEEKEVRVHPRDEKVFEAKIKLCACLNGVGGELTDGEMIRVIAEAGGDYVLFRAAHMIRLERHGDEDIPGGVLCECAKCQALAGNG